MFIRFQCRRCKHVLSVAAAQAGNPMHCPTCRSELIVPSSSERIQRPAPNITVGVTAAAPEADIAVGVVIPAAVEGAIACQPLPSMVFRVEHAPAPQPRRLATPATRGSRRLIACFAVVVCMVAAGLISAHVWSRLNAGQQDTSADGSAGQEDETNETLAQLMTRIDASEGLTRTGVMGSEQFETPAGHATGGTALRPGVLNVPTPGGPRLTGAGDPVTLMQPSRPSPGSAGQTASVGPIHLTRRDDRSEESLRQELNRVPAVALTPPDVLALVEGYHASYQMSAGTHFEPTTVLLAQRPDLATLPMRAGSACRIDGRAAANLQVLSRKLHAYLDQAAPKDRSGKRIDPALLREIMWRERRGKRPEWLRVEAIPTLLQLLMPEDRPVRLLLVELLAAIPEKPASHALAQRAIFDLAPEVRQAAITALKDRPRSEYREVFLAALRYPWAPAADHAAEALVLLKDEEAVPRLVSMLRLADPSKPWLLNDGRAAVREVVRLQHTRNCLTCHPAAVTSTDPVTGPVPDFNFTHIKPQAQTTVTAQRTDTQRPGQTFSVSNPRSSPSSGGGSSSSGGGGGGGGGYGGGSSSASSPASSSSSTVQTPALSRAGLSLSVTRSVSINKTEIPLLIRADITYLRQDFSLQQPLTDTMTALPVEARFDYLVRTRTYFPRDPEKIRHKPDDGSSYEQKEAVLFALRELTGQDAGTTADAWLQLYPRAEFENEVSRLSAALVRASTGSREQLLAKFKTTKGAVYTHALAAAIPGLTGAFQEKARAALVERLTRMTAATLHDKLHEEDVEVRRAAVQAAVARAFKEFLPDLICLLRDEEPAVAQAALLGLKGLTGQQLGPDGCTTRQDWIAAAETWRAWWEGQTTE